MNYTLTERLHALLALRQEMLAVAADTNHSLYTRARHANLWFEPAFVQQALRAIADSMAPESLEGWARRYVPENGPATPRTVAVIMAGNLPLVGWHDALCILVSGHRLQARLSHQDQVLMTWVLTWLQTETPVFADAIEIVERVVQPDAVIATGSDNSSRYFEAYFGKYPHIIRGNRTSLAVLTGNETPKQLEALVHDIFLYAGLGCRNVGKLLVPRGYDFEGVVLAANHHYGWLQNVTKWSNNYDYQKAVCIINRLYLVDAHFFILREHEDLVAPTAVVYFSYYDHPEDISGMLAPWEDKLQVVVGTGYTPFGQAQHPRLDDYADGVDVMAWLQQL